MVTREPPAAEPEVAELLRRIDACYLKHADRVALDAWVHDEAQHSHHAEVAAGALAYLANNAFFMGELPTCLDRLDRAEEIFARTPVTHASLNMRWVTFNVRAMLVRSLSCTNETLREAIEYNMAGMRFAGNHGIERGVAVSGLNAGLELVRLGKAVEALLLMTRLLEMRTFDQRTYAHIREVTGFALASGGYFNEALGQFQMALDAAEPRCHAQRARVSIAMANCAVDAGQIDIASFEADTGQSVLDFIESSNGCAALVRTHRNCLNQVKARILARRGQAEAALRMVDEAFRVSHDWFIHRSNTALDVWLTVGCPHYAFDETKPQHRSEFGGQLRYAVLLERCAAETGRLELALEMRRRVVAERAGHGVNPELVLKLAGPNAGEIKARQERTQAELAKIVALAEWQDNLLTMTAHELRGPLTALQLASELLLSDADAHERLETLVPLVERIQRTTEGFQSLIQLADDPVAHQIEPRLITDELRIAVDSLRHAARTKRIDIRTTGLERDYFAHTGRGYVVISVANLISNAIKYSPPLTVIDVSASWVDDRIMIDVRDQGPGIAHDDRAVAFDWQVRLNHKPTGNETSQGIGLSITRTLVEAAGGTVEILDQSPGTPGAHFRITWRASHHQVPSPGAGDHRGPGYGSSSIAS